MSLQVLKKAYRAAYVENQHVAMDWEEQLNCATYHCWAKKHTSKSHRDVACAIIAMMALARLKN